MIKLMHVEYRHDYIINCEFSDGTASDYDLKPLLWSCDTVLTETLREKSAFRKFFLRSGALCWFNGLELDPQAIYSELQKSGKLYPLLNAA